MVVEELYTSVKRVFPDVTIADCVRLVNEALQSESSEITDIHNVLFIDVVANQRYYRLPDHVNSVETVWFMDSEGEYRRISRLVGVIDTTDET